jgi:glycosyltransferase involved in cell wall biosynthesis
MARIGIDARLAYYTRGGIAGYIRHLIRALAEVGGGHDYVILHSRKHAENLATAPDQRRAALWTPAHHRIERLALAAELLPRRLDVLHSTDFIPPLAGRYHSVITVYDLAFLRYPEFLTAESRRYYNDQIEAAVRRADAIIAISEATRADLETLLGVPRDKVTVTWLAADEAFHPQPPEEIARVRAAHDLPADYALFVGTLEPRKNLRGLLRAYAELCADLPDAPPLVVAGGKGWLAGDLPALVADLGLAERVVWAGHVPPADLPALYGGASVFCLPSHYEGFGMPPLEAMACGTPVVVSDRASLPEVVGEAGLLVDPDDPASIADGLRRVLTDSGLAAAMRERGLIRAAAFDWRETARRTIAVYERVLR